MKPPIPQKRHRPLGLDDSMPFGKYRGDPLWLVIDTDPGYISWCIENTDLELDNEAYAAYKKARP